jgi:hypothetical protein
MLKFNDLINQTKGVKRENMVRETLPNGMTFEGTAAQLLEVKKALGIFVADGLHYNSSTKGVVEIAKMEDTHIKNAVRKIITSKVQAMDTRATNREFLTNLQNITAGDVTFVALVMELAKRINR